MTKMNTVEDLKQALDKASITLPARINFILVRDTKTGKYSIVFNKMRNTCKLENIKFSHTGALFLSSNVGVTVGIEDISDAQLLYDRLGYYAKRWVDMSEEEEK